MRIKSYLIKFFTSIKNLQILLKSNLNYATLSFSDVLSDQLYSVDEITASDLSLDEFDTQYNGTFTSCGNGLFRHWLHTIKNRAQIENLQSDMKKLNENTEVPYLENCLEKYIGMQKNDTFIRDMWNGFSTGNFLIKYFPVIYLLNLAINIVLSFFFQKYMAAFIILFFVLNFVFYLISNIYISHILSSVGYFLSICYTLRKIQKNMDLELSLKFPDYKKFIKLSKYAVFFKEGMGGPSSGDIFSILVDYLRIFFGMELLAFKIVEKRISENLADVREIYFYAGYLDFVLNNIRIMKNNECCFSELTEENVIDFEGLKHPLVQNCVPQDKNLNSNLVITGMNMSGKTTFMKSLALNQILATSFGFCFAKTYKTRIYDVISSITINDKLLAGKSRYYAEAERLLEIKKLSTSHSCLCFIDEILSGTNSEERIFGSTKILMDLNNAKSRIIAATHDLQIAENIKEFYAPVYFDGETNGYRIIFDYKLKEGVVSKKNGLLILKLLGL